MGITRKHISKSGKSILAFRRQPVIGSSGVIPREANGPETETGARPMGKPTVSIDAVFYPFFLRPTPQAK